jgi:type I restriction-modification system DNA methylase subunit
MNSATLVQKLWNYCNVLRDDGMSYGDYVEQLTYLLFLKMADERSRPPYHQPMRRKRQAREELRSPLIKNLLRPAGHRLREQLEENRLDVAFDVALLMFVPAAIL